MSDLATLKAAAGTAEQAFRDAIAGAYADEWAFYHACEGRGAKPTQAHLDAHDAWICALHRFYAARDGAGGVLGGRGL